MLDESRLAVFPVNNSQHFDHLAHSGVGTRAIDEFRHDVAVGFRCLLQALKTAIHLALIALGFDLGKTSNLLLLSVFSDFENGNLDTKLLIFITYSSFLIPIIHLLIRNQKDAHG